MTVPPPPEARRPTAVTGRHLPALNGLRGLAVLGVVAYHLQLGWASGGYLGVDLFFVLSGFLITTLLLEEWGASGRINLANFWARRARRLLPALFLVVFALAIYVCNAQLGGPGANALIDLPDLRGDAIATLLYVGNWHAIFAHQSYFAQFSTPSPLQHTWSLAIEEQFYLVWPLVLLLVLRLGRRSWRQFGLVVTVAVGLASAALMALLFHPGGDPTRVYYGTDTRLFDLMAGATLAFLAGLPSQPNPRAQRTLHIAAPIAAIGLGVCWVTSGTSGGLPRDWMFDGGFLLCAVLAAVVVADARLTQPGTLGRLLATPPLHFLGTISYGIYLWHWPIFVYLTGTRTGLSTFPLDVVRVVLTLVVSTASYYLVERPLRQAHFRGLIRLWLAPVAAVVTAVVVVVATFPAVADPGTVVKTTHLARWIPPPKSPWPALVATRTRSSHHPGPTHPVGHATPPRDVDKRRLRHARLLLRHHRCPRSDRRSDCPHEYHRRIRFTTATNWPTSVPRSFTRPEHSSSWPAGAGTRTDRPRPTPCISPSSTRRYSK